MKRISLATSARFSQVPVERSSTTVTSCPLARRRRTRLEPMKPAPPVTNALALSMTYLPTTERIPFLRQAAFIVASEDALSRTVERSLCVRTAPVGERLDIAELVLFHVRQ